jgi:tetratricopeptide (TPR) repeat protein
VLRKALRAKPNSIDVQTSLARAMLLVGKNEDAIRELASALESNPNHPEALRLRGEARTAMGEYRQGVHDLEEAIRVGGDTVEVRILLARTYATARDGRYRDPRKALDNARVAVDKSRNKNPEAIAALAGAYASAGDYTRAVVEMRKAVKLDPTNQTYATALQAYERRAGGR